MKIRESKSPKPSKTYKRVSELDPENARTKICLPKGEEEYLSPMHIKIPKPKIKGRKDQKSTKNGPEFEEKTTKRKEKKKPTHSQENGSSIIQDNLELLMTIKEDKTPSKTKAKTTEKTCRKSNRHHPLNDSLKGENNQAEALKTHSKLSLSYKKSSCLGVNIPQEEYMFIGDEFYLINNYYPTKRLLNTFREVCSQENYEGKFITQDKNEKGGKQKLDLKKNNIFVAARKEIQMKRKVQKIIMLQRWWRRMITKHHLIEQRSNPEMTAIHNVSPVKTSFDSFDDITPIKPYLDDINKEDRIVTPTQQNPDVVSFNSTEIIGQGPKKIEFKQEDLSKMLMGSYKLPQHGEVDHSQNEAIFNNYSTFKITEAEIGNHSESEDSTENLLSPGKDDHYPTNIKETTVQDKEPNFDLFKQFQEATRIKELIQQRIYSQKGQVKSSERAGKVGISTSILSIHNMLVNFFHFYINKYRDQFLSLINMPFGYSIIARLKALRGQPLPQEVEEDSQGAIYGLKEIIDDEKLDQYFKYVEVRQNRMNNSFSKANFELEKIHFKAVLDYFNEELNEYRPYKQINGVPYPWNNSEKALTFYFVTEDNIAQVFEKAELKVLKSTSLLCGIIIPETQKKNNEASACQNVDDFMQKYQKDNNGMILQHNDAKEVKLIHEGVKSETFEHGFEIFSCVLLETANQIFRELILQTVLEFPGFDFQRLIY